MRVAIVTGQAERGTAVPGQAAGADPGGLIAHVTALARAVAGLGHQVTVYARRDSAARQPADGGGVMTEYLPAGPAAPLAEEELLSYLGRFSDALAQRWRLSRPDVVHAHFWTGGLAALAAVREVPAPVVQTFHSLSAPAPGPLAADPVISARRTRLEAFVARSVRAVLAGSSREISALTRLGVPRSAIRVVACGVDTERFAPGGPVARRSKRPRLLALFPVTEDHGLDVVVRALAGLPGTELVIAGGPPRSVLRSDPAFGDLLRLAERLQVSDRLLITGQVSRARLPALLRSADLFVHLAMDEPRAVAPLEAMACGTPVVAAAGGAHQDAVVDGATGALVPPGDPAALARCIRELLASPMLLEGYGIAAADRVRTRYSWDRVGQETLAVYGRACQVA